LRWDLTQEKEFTLSSATIKALGGLEDRLTLKMYYSKELPPQLLQVQNNVSDLLSEVKAHAKQSVIIEYIDPSSNEQREQETQALGIPPLELNIVDKDKVEVKKAYMGMALYYRDKREVIPILAQVQNLEYILALSVLKLTRAELPLIGIFSSDAEEQQGSSYQAINELINQMGKAVPVTEDDMKWVDKKLSALLVINPRDVKSNFVKKWDEVLQEGTTILIFSGHQNVTGALVPVPVTTGIDEWLDKKGVSISDEILLDVKQNAQAAFSTGMLQVYMPYPFWVRALKNDLNRTHPVTAQLEDLLLPWTNVIEKTATTTDWQMTPLATSSANSSFLQPAGATSVGPQYVNELTDFFPEFKSHTVSAVFEKSGEVQTGKIFLMSNASALEDRFLQMSQTNVVFLANMLEYATWGNELIGIRSRGQSSRPLKEVSLNAKMAIKWGHMAALPLLAVFLGMAVLFWHKKRRQRLIEEITV
jgi:ABC-type uncharacterized transport system involved in gliding motility auxiliary subunit